MTSRNITNIKKPKRFALYRRVSAGKQAKEGDSLGAQLRILRAYVAHHQGVIVGEYVDGGRSARDVSRRPAYKRMMAERHLWDAVLILKHDRLHRNVVNGGQMDRDLAQYGKELISVQDQVDQSTAAGRFALRNIRSGDEYESDKARERTLTAHDNMWARGGDIHIGQTSYGYRRKGNKRLVHHRNAAIIKRIFEWADQGKTCWWIACKLNELRIDTPGGAKHWSAACIRSILTNRTYLGEFRWGKRLKLKAHPALVSPVLFERVQRLLKGQARAFRPDLYPRKQANLAVWISKRQQRLRERAGIKVRPLFGYRFDKDGVYVPYPPEAVIVQRAFAIALEDIGATLIARRLLQEGHKPPIANHWTATTIQAMLGNAHYTGELHVNGRRYPRTHQPLIDYTTFDQVQMLLIARRNKFRKVGLDLNKQGAVSHRVWQAPPPTKPKRLQRNKKRKRKKRVRRRKPKRKQTP